MYRILKTRFKMGKITRKIKKNKKNIKRGMGVHQGGHAGVGPGGRTVESTRCCLRAC